VCGSIASRDRRPVLWPELVAEWQLTPAEADLVDRREGECCASCGASLRTAALAAAVVHHARWAGSLASWVESGPTLRVLEINRAGTLTAWLERLAGHRLVEFPAVDMHALEEPDASWDLIIHSDTLEHVDDPVAALAECRRVVAPGGAVCFTAPALSERLTRRRDDLPPSYHGSEQDPAYLVVTEYGADFWTDALDAGFSVLSLVAPYWPVSVAYVAVP